MNSKSFYQRATVIFCSLLLMLGATLLLPADAQAQDPQPANPTEPAAIYKPQLIKISAGQAEMAAANAAKPEATCRGLWLLGRGWQFYLPLVVEGPMAQNPPCADADISGFTNGAALKAVRVGMVAPVLDKADAQLAAGDYIPQATLSYVISSTSPMTGLTTSGVTVNGRKFDFTGVYRIEKTEVATVGATSSSALQDLTPQEVIDLARAKEIDLLTRTQQDKGQIIVYGGDTLYAGPGRDSPSSLFSAVCPALPLGRAGFITAFPRSVPIGGGVSEQQIWVKIRFLPEVVATCPATVAPFVWMEWTKFWAELPPVVQTTVDGLVDEKMDQIPFTASVSWVPDGGGTEVVEETLIYIVEIGIGVIIYAVAKGGLPAAQPGMFMFVAEPHLE